MTSILEKPSINWLRQCFYPEVEGKLFWRERPESHFGTFSAFMGWNSRFAEREAGSLNRTKGRWRIRFTDFMTLRRYQIVWAMAHGEWVEAPFMIDHKDRNSLNDRIGNLSVVTAWQNAQNRNPRGFRK